MSTALENPDRTAFTYRPSARPPAWTAISSISGVPIGTSTTTGRTTSPTTVHTTGPGESSVPIERYHSGPRARMWGTLASVSTLLTSVGFASSVGWASFFGADDQPAVGPVAKRPCRYGGAQRGSGSSPSMTCSRAVSSPTR